MEVREYRPLGRSERCRCKSPQWQNNKLMEGWWRKQQDVQIKSVFNNDYERDMQKRRCGDEDEGDDGNIIMAN